MEDSNWKSKKALLGRYTVDEVAHTLQKNVDGLDIEPLIKLLKKRFKYSHIDAFKPSITAPPIKSVDPMWFDDSEIELYWDIVEFYWNDLNKWLDSSRDLKNITWRFPEPNPNNIVRAMSLDEIHRGIESYSGNKTAFAKATGLKAKGNLDAIIKKKEEEIQDKQFANRNKK